MDIPKFGKGTATVSTGPGLGKKACPKCQAHNRSGVAKCIGCGYEWPRRAPPNSAAKKVDDRPEFVAGLTPDGKLMLTWPRDEEFIVLSVAEANLVDRVLSARVPGGGGE